MEVAAEAGPSRPRTPPPLPSKDGWETTTTTPKTRRKSWFSFGQSPGAWATSLPADGDALRRTSVSSLRKSKEEQVESIELQTPGQADGMAKHEDQAGMDDVLTIDGELEAASTIKRKKKKRRSKDAEEEGEAMRMDELGGKRSDSLDAASSPSAQDGARSSHESQSRSRPRTMDKPIPNISARSSSISQYSTPLIHVDHPDKPQPPIPVERPLPPLPTSNSLGSLPIPDGIVVTPSSPRKLTKQRSASSSRTELATHTLHSQRSRSRDSSRTGTPRNGSRAPSPIGLGLPPASSKGVGVGGSETPPPPPVPSKTRTMVSVSSPHPSRPASPIRVAFDTNEKGDADSGGEDGRKGRVKRARSLSGLWGKAASVPSKPPSAPGTPEDEVEVLAEHKPSMLEWLGVKKTAKRRPSEAKLDQAASAAAAADVGGLRRPSTASGDTPLASRESLHVYEEPRSSGSLDVSRGRPELRSEASSNTVVPPPHSNRIASLFARRVSSKEPLGDDSGHSTPSQSQPIPGALPHAGRSIASSSTSSMVLPPLGAPSPDFMGGSAPWMSSPTTESDLEEKLFSPGDDSVWGPGKRPWMEHEPPSAPNRSMTSSPLSGGEGGGKMGPPAPILIKTEGRLRSFSDAASPPNLAPRSRDQSPHRSSNVLSKSLQPSPITPARPKLGSRTNSGNSAIIDRMKTVFAKSASTRARSNSATSSSTPPGQSTSEFGAMRDRASTLSSAGMRTTTSSSSITSSSTSRVGPNASLLDLIEGERRVFVNDTPQRSPRTSLTGTFSSFGTGSTRTSTTTDPRTSTSNRPRASTVSFIAPPAPLAPPQLTSPGLHPVSATPPRRRPSAISRISTGLFSGPSSPKRGDSLFPLPPRMSSSTSSGVTGFGNDDVPSGLLSPVSSPRPSNSSLGASAGATPTTRAEKKAAVQRDGDDSPEMWVSKVVRSIGRNEIAGVLAASGDGFHTEALKLYMSQFDFTHNPLDVALRKLLMQMSLPKETQQIDRVIEGFASRYEECEPGLFEAKDNTYVLAFSMMMLHTDAFNRHNKNKMTKADYVRNTRLDGVSPIVLEAFYDNITFTPFVFIEDDADLKRTSLDSGASPMGLTPTLGATTTTKTKIDVYHMIVRGLLPTLRVDVQGSIPAESPFSCLGTRPFLEMDSLHRAFTQAHTLRISLPSPKKKGPAAMVIPDKSSGRDNDELVLKITKVGLVSRKDELVEGGRKAASKKWKNLSAVLTGSQLVFFKDPMWALALMEQIRLSAARPTEQLLPRTTSFKPEEVYSLKDCIAVYDRDFSKNANTFRLIMPHGHQYLIQAADEYEMNEWIGLINYAATFKTAGIRMRAGSMDKDQAVLAGAAAAASHKRELQDLQDPAAGVRRPVFGESAFPFDEAPTATVARSGEMTPLQLGPESRDAPTPHLSAPASLGLSNGALLDIAGANDVAEEDGERLEEVFDVVKAELAAGRGGADALPSSTSQAANGVGRKRGLSKAHASRAEAISAQLHHLQTRIMPLERQLSNHIRLARNLAILTPFQKSTRERVAAQLPALARTIRNDRLLLAKYRLYMTVLTKDAERDTREWARVRHVALQAANRSLRDPKGVRGVVEEVHSDGEVVVPSLSVAPVSPVASGNRSGPTSPIPISPISPISPHPSTSPVEPHSAPGRRDAASPASDGPLSGTSPGELPIMMRRPSQDPTDRARPAMNRHTSTGSIRSRPSSLAYRVETPGFSRRSTGDLLSPDREGRRDTEDEGSPSNQGTPLLFPLSDAEEPAEPRARPGAEVDDKPHETAERDESEGGEDEKEGKEEAEDWQRTKAAKRVSLASTGEHSDWLRMSKRTSRDGHSDHTNGAETPPKKEEKEEDA